ncbi:chitin deacetylase [Boothiomyces sp. JEL0866]|nr:chitin deacetylase [Boothiomyces sp. JEL0866]
MDYPNNDVGSPVAPSPAFNAQYQSALNIRTGPGVEWEKSSCKGNSDWALTYDDGPSQYTPEVVNQLTKHNFKGTFFVVGSQVKKHPEVLVQAYKAGMEIGIHTWTHPVMTRLTNEQIVAELIAPYGTTDGRLRGIAQALGFVMIRWNRDTGDATTNGRSLKPQFDLFMNQPIIGTISLEHDLHAETAQLAPYGMDKVSKSKYTQKTISECTGEQPYRKIDPIPPMQTIPSVTTSPAKATTAASHAPSTGTLNLPLITTSAANPNASPIPTGPPSNPNNNYFSSPVTIRTQTTTRAAQSGSSTLEISLWFILLLI